MACLFISANFHQAHGLGTDAFLPAFKGQALGGGGLDVNPAGWQTQSVGHILPHLRDVVEQLGPLGDNGDVRIGDPGVLVEQEGHHMRQQLLGGDALVLRVGVR